MSPSSPKRDRSPCARPGARWTSTRSSPKSLLEDEVTIDVTLHAGDAQVTAWGCDLTYDYVKINGDYRT